MPNKGPFGPTAVPFGRGPHRAEYRPPSTTEAQAAPTQLPSPPFPPNHGARALPNDSRHGCGCVQPLRFPGRPFPVTTGALLISRGLLRADPSYQYESTCVNHIDIANWAARSDWPGIAHVMLPRCTARSEWERLQTLCTAALT